MRISYSRSLVRSMALVGGATTLAIALGGGCAAGGNDTSDTGAAAGSSAAGNTNVGHVTQPCFPNKTCFDNLSCVSGVCVDLSSIAGNGGAGGSSAAGTGGAPAGGAGGASAGGASGGTSGTAGTSATGGATAGGHAGSSAGTGGKSAGGSNAGTSAQGGSSGTQGGSSTQGGSGGVSFGAGGMTGGSSGATSLGGQAGIGGGCAGEVFAATQDPAALLFVLDRSESMSKVVGNETEWGSLSDAVNQALALPEFDTMYVGALASPTAQNTPGPACIFNIPVPCLAPTAPQIPLTLVGSDPASTPMSLRAQVAAGLIASVPPSNPNVDPNANPLYAAIQTGIAALNAWPMQGKRIMVVVTDGTIDCTSLSSPQRPGYPDGNGCSHEWENPQNIVDMLTAANTDPNTPIETFIVGVPGADSYDPSGVNYPPYHMRNALSAMAYAGAPMYVPQNCTGTMYTQSGGDPTVPCHFDMTTGTYSGAALAANIAQVRSATLGCVFHLPMPSMGMINLDDVNVQVDTGSGPMEIPRRNDPNDMCTNDPCWDYDANDDVVIIGQECSAIEQNGQSQVTIVVGCTTVHKPLAASYFPE